MRCRLEYKELTQMCPLVELQNQIRIVHKDAITNLLIIALIQLGINYYEDHFKAKTLKRRNLLGTYMRQSPGRGIEIDLHEGQGGPVNHSSFGLHHPNFEVRDRTLSCQSSSQRSHLHDHDKSQSTSNKVQFQQQEEHNVKWTTAIETYEDYLDKELNDSSKNYSGSGSHNQHNNSNQQLRGKEKQNASLQNGLQQ
ncbi:UNKNOWN [Stylonychia lemnae]|uniref:Uncharacterized protein n=1 Tax=Stylonychia lemnae TaxID=5949 RepID=A0A078A7D6_STYLE|nr:UNKNOWN [Stylonychia lemnae]|eukprot:CDW77786.1 UNKNOWN [Stylonychia lemnae]